MFCRIGIIIFLFSVHIWGLHEKQTRGRLLFLDALFNKFLQRHLMGDNSNSCNLPQENFAFFQWSRLQLTGEKSDPCNHYTSE